MILGGLFLFANLAMVDPFVGTAGIGHTTPAATVPFGGVQAGPDTGTLLGLPVRRHIASRLIVDALERHGLRRFHRGERAENWFLK